jgi:hypothetical protein
MFEVNTSSFFRQALCCLATGFFIFVFRSLYYAMACLYPKSHPKTGSQPVKRLLFPLMILEGFKSGEDYAATVNAVSIKEIGKEYALQVYINSNIYLAKVKNLNLSLGSLKICLVIWIFSNGTLILEYLRPTIYSFMTLWQKGH